MPGELCSKCRVGVEFYNAKDSWCKDCKRAAMRGKGFEYNRRKNLWNFYRVTPEWYDAQLEGQGGTCWLCPRKPTPERALAVDHDHACCPGKRSCGKCVRGLICTECNKGLSYMDRPDWVARATEYLMRGHITNEC